MDTRWWRTVLVAAVTVGAIPLAAPAAHAGWTDARTVSQDGWRGGSAPEVATDREGDSLLVWNTTEDVPNGFYVRAQARTVSRTGELGPIRTVSPPDQATVSWPELAVDDDGDAVIAWSHFDPGFNGWRMYARQLSRTGELGPLIPLNPKESGNDPAVAISPAGDAVVAWHTSAPGHTAVEARRISRTGAVSDLLDLGSHDPATPVDVAVDQRGTATVVFGELGATPVTARRIGPDGSLAVPLDLSLGQHNLRYYSPRIGLDRDGAATVTFQVDGSDGKRRLYGRTLPRDGAPTPAVQLSPEGADLYLWGDLDTTPDGDAVVVWSTGPYLREPNKNTTLYARRWGRDGALTPVVNLGSGAAARLALDDAGNGVLVNEFALVAGRNDDTGIQLRTVDRAGTFGSPVELSRTGQTPAVGVAPQGGSAVLWHHTDHPYPVKLVTGE